MEAIDTAQLSELLMVLKNADVRRFKSDGQFGMVEIEFSAPEVVEERTEAVGFAAVGEPTVTTPIVRKEEPEEDVPAHLPPSYHKLFGKQIPRFPSQLGNVADNAQK